MRRPHRRNSNSRSGRLAGGVGGDTLAAPEGERVQKALARSGFGSRRQLEALISEGKVKVNHKVATLGQRVRANDRVSVDGRAARINWPSKQSHGLPRVLVYHKPAGEICTRSDPEGRPTPFDRLPPLRGGRWVGVGRLDVNTSGLLLFTDDGELANRLMHPAQQVEREYAVRVLGSLDRSTKELLSRGVLLSDGEARLKSVMDAGGEGANRWYHVIVTEGRNRVVRRLLESQELTVSRLIRIRVGPLRLPRHLRQGRWQRATTAEVRSLLRSTDARQRQQLVTEASHE